MERFSATASIEELKAKANNTNTTKTTRHCLCGYHSWAKPRNWKTKKLKGWSLADWRGFSCSFMQKWKGRMALTDLERCLREAGYIYLLLTIRNFLNSRFLREQEKGKYPSNSCSLSHGEIVQLWQSGQFDYHSPVALINTLWWPFTHHFGLRRRQEHHNMKIEYFTFKKHYGFTKVTFSKGITKPVRVNLMKNIELKYQKCMKLEMVVVQWEFSELVS